MTQSLTARLLGDPDPDRFAKSEALRLSLPEPRPELALSEWLGEHQPIGRRRRPSMPKTLTVPTAPAANSWMMR